MVKTIISYKILQGNFPGVVYNHVDKIIKERKMKKTEVDKIAMDLSKAPSREEFANIVHEHFSDELKLLTII